MLPPFTAEPFLGQPVIPAWVPHLSVGTWVTTQRMFLFWRRAGGTRSCEIPDCEILWYQTTAMLRHADCGTVSQHSPLGFSTYFYSVLELLESGAVSSAHFIHPYGCDQECRTSWKQKSELPIFAVRERKCFTMFVISHKKKAPLWCFLEKKQPPPPRLGWLVHLTRNVPFGTAHSEQQHTALQAVYP